MDTIDFTPLILSIKLSIITTIILFFISLPLALWLSQTKSKLKPFIETITALPIVLPPSVLGFYLLVFLSPDSFLGSILKYFDINLLFTFSGILIASCIYSLPFMTQPLQNGFESLDKHLIEASYLSGKSKLTTLFRVILPNIRYQIITALIITFAHTMGEFGVVLLVGGSIDGETKVASVAIYEMVELLNYKDAYFYSFLMLIISFFILFIIYWIKKRH